MRNVGAFKTAAPSWKSEGLFTKAAGGGLAPSPSPRPRDDRQRDHLRRLIEAGIALSSERDHKILIEKILLEAKSLANADGGTLYLSDQEKRLHFAIVRNDTLDIALGGTTGKAIPFPPLNIIDPETGEPNFNNVCTAAVVDGRTINIPDAYEADAYDFSGTKKFDETTGYRSKSFLTIPLRNHKDEVVGVLQLINARGEGSTVIPFDFELQQIIEALASQAAIALDNQELIASQRQLLDSLIKLLAGAIDAKSPYTSGHCDRVPELAQMLAREAAGTDWGPFANFSMTDEETYEFELASWLHDCGKITSPEYVVDKATKLETIHNRIHEIRARFEILWRDAEVDCLRGILDGGDKDVLTAEMNRRRAQLREDFAFVAKSNIGGEFMDPENVARLEVIAETKWTRNFDDRLGLSRGEEDRLKDIPPVSTPSEEKLLADRPEHVIPWGARKPPVHKDDPQNLWGFDMEIPENAYNFGELYNLSIRRGTLTEEERFKINDHIVQTIIMLDSLPLPRQLRRMPEIAGNHHEKMDGTGYPRRLPPEDLSVPARVMAIADIFEALTAADRPYKTPKTLSQSIDILSKMVLDKHIDGDLFDLFLTSGVYREYGETHLRPEQVDAVDISRYVGLRPKTQAAE
ncbi:MAG: GAF domain-containing protein [Rhodospirillum sp.]|nr:GAF domain-containing protein [Rhodospirillum sp.]MCF8491701.1 GAF domain-containing protein [Rhodospirillum sp.]MCF8502643.1 GAF domain-containing protein [Rhodospirillum sp.]